MGVSQRPLRREWTVFHETSAIVLHLCRAHDSRHNERSVRRVLYWRHRWAHVRDTRRGRGADHVNTDYAA